MAPKNSDVNSQNIHIDVEASVRAKVIMNGHNIINMGANGKYFQNVLLSASVTTSEVGIVDSNLDA